MRVFSRIRTRHLVLSSFFTVVLLLAGWMYDASYGADTHQAQALDIEVVETALEQLPQVVETVIDEVTFHKEGTASWYGPGFHGRLTANGEIYDQYEYTAAHKKLPFGTILRVTNPRNGRKTLARVNDRGPYIGDRIIDLSETVAQELDVALGKVTIEAFLPVARKRLKHLPSQPLSDTVLMSFNRSIEAVQIEGDLEVVHTTTNFTEAMRTWNADNADTFLRVVEPRSSEDDLKQARKMIRAHRGSPYYRYEIVKKSLQS